MSTDNPTSQEIINEIGDVNDLIKELQGERKRLKKLLSLTEEIEALQLLRTHKILFGEDDV